MLTFRAKLRRILTGFVCCILLGGLSAATRAPKLEVEGFTEPYRTINVAADETGTIQEVLVREGQAVDAGQALARLNSDIYQAQLAIAEQNMLAQGKLAAARANLNMHRHRLEKLVALHSNGHAREEEVERASAEVAIGEANVLTAQEELITRKLEYEKIRAQIARRTVHAPVTGFITSLHKDMGEFVSPTSPEVLTLVQIDKLLANFTVMGSEAGTVHTGQEVHVRFPGSNSAATGSIVYVSPVTDAESGTVLVKVEIDNADGRFRSGERCKIRIGK